MSLYVLKFGGSSVATTTRIAHVTKIIQRFIEHGDRVVVVSSAMKGVTNRLVNLAKSFCDSSFNREYDAIVSCGEQVACALLAMALNSVNLKAKSFSSWQVPIRVSGEYSDAEITSLDKASILHELDQGVIPVITGFQGISLDGSIRTIGRGGSDATACAIAKFIDADECIIYTDVDGVYTSDPRIVLNSRKLSEVSYDDMVELAFWGAKVLQTKSTLIAKKYNVCLRVLSSFSDSSDGTNVSKTTKYVLRSLITGIAHTQELSLISLRDESKLEPINRFIYFKAPDFALISKNVQGDVKATLNGNGVDFEIDNDIGVIAIVGAFDKEKICSEVKEIARSNGIVIKKLISNPDKKSISFLTPFQQTESFVNILHESFLKNDE